MLRTALIVLFLALVGFGFWAWASGGLAPSALDDRRRPTDSNVGKRDGKPSDRTPVPTPRPEGERRSEPTPVTIKVLVANDNARREPLIIADGRISIVQGIDVSAQRSGRIQLLGVEAPPGVKTERQEKFYFLATMTTPEEARVLGMPHFPIAGDERVWRRWRRDVDLVEPGKIRLVHEVKYFRPLLEGQRVKKDDLLGLIDPDVARSDLESKVAKLLSAEADARASGKTKDETRTRYERQETLYRKIGTGREELDAAKLTWERYVEEEKAKLALLEVARRDVQQAEVILGQHEIRAPIAGTVRRIYGREGEAVKEQNQQVFRIENADWLQVEGFVELQNADRLEEGDPVIVEASKAESPIEWLRGHREPITAVAVATLPDGSPLILSAGEDRTVRVWGLKFIKANPVGKDRWQGEERLRLDHPSVIRSLACSPVGSPQPLLLTGSADGIGQVWDLAVLDSKARPTTLKEAHRGAILATAVSADGKWCATGGEDKALCLWDAETGKLLDREELAHKGAITSLAFTPAGVLVSAGRDNRLAQWEVNRDGALKLLRSVDNRGGQVEQLGLNRDGTQVLFDQGSQLRVLDLEDPRQPRGRIYNPSGAANFTTFALFSPDGQTVLTAGATENRLQLWSNPVPSAHKRAVEMRQYIWADAPATSAAFGKHPQGGGFVVTGMRDRNVLVWRLPDGDELKELEAPAVVRSKGESIDNGQRQVRIIVDVLQKNRRLVANDKANIVVYPR